MEKLLDGFSRVLFHESVKHSVEYQEVWVELDEWVEKFIDQSIQFACGVEALPSGRSPSKVRSMGTHEYGSIV